MFFKKKPHALKTAASNALRNFRQSFHEVVSEINIYNIL